MEGEVTKTNSAAGSRASVNKEDSRMGPMNKPDSTGGESGVKRHRGRGQGRGKGNVT